MEWEKNNGENSGQLTSLPVDRLTATDCNAAARANTCKRYVAIALVIKISFLIIQQTTRQQQPLFLARYEQFLPSSASTPLNSNLTSTEDESLVFNF